MRLIDRLIVALAMIVPFFLGGCDNPFNPVSERLSGSPDRPVADNPVSVLENLALAYNRQDIDLYGQCLSESFRFILISSEVQELGLDLDNDGLRDNWWGYKEEIETHRRLFGYTTSQSAYPAPYNISLNLTIPPETLWESASESGYEECLIIPCAFNLQLNFLEDGTLDARGFARFYLRNEDGIWRILRWQDESNV